MPAASIPSSLLMRIRGRSRLSAIRSVPLPQ